MQLIQSRATEAIWKIMYRGETRLSHDFCLCLFECHVRSLEETFTFL